MVFVGPHNPQKYAGVSKGDPIYTVDITPVIHSALCLLSAIQFSIYSAVQSVLGRPVFYFFDPPDSTLRTSSFGTKTFPFAALADLDGCHECRDVLRISPSFPETHPFIFVPMYAKSS